METLTLKSAPMLGARIEGRSQRPPFYSKTSKMNSCFNPKGYLPERLRNEQNLIVLPAVNPRAGLGLRPEEKGGRSYPSRAEARVPSPLHQHKP